MTECSVRPMQTQDIDHIIHYLLDMPPADIERIGLAAANLPAREELFAQLAQTCHAKPESARTFYSIWLVNGEPIGHSSLKDIHYGERGSMHLHMWTKPVRGKGYGGILFCKSALDFYERFQLESIICEPRASNPFPNRMLQKLGFPLLETYWGASSELSVVCELNRYSIDRTIAERYLEHRAGTHP